MLIELVNSDLGRKLAAKRMRDGGREEGADRSIIPRRYALIDLWENHGGDRAAMQKAEIASFARLLVTDTSRNLVRVFFLREKLKSLADGEWTGRACPRHRRRRHGRRHRRLVRVARLHRHASPT